MGDVCSVTVCGGGGGWGGGGMSEGGTSPNVSLGQFCQLIISTRGTFPAVQKLPKGPF